MDPSEVIPSTPPDPAMESDQERGGAAASESEVEDKACFESDHEDEDENEGKASVKSEPASSVGLSPSDIVQEIKALRNDIVDIKIMCKNIIHGLKNLKQHKDAHPLQPMHPPPPDVVPPFVVPPTPPPPSSATESYAPTWTPWIGRSWSWPETTAGPGPSWSKEWDQTHQSDPQWSHKRKWGE